MGQYQIKQDIKDVWTIYGKITITLWRIHRLIRKTNNSKLNVLMMDGVMVVAINQQDKLLVQYIWWINAGD